MRRRRSSFNSVKSSTIIMDGGLNENISSLELKGGELVSAFNYELLEGSQGGYSSIRGYERYDGNTRPSSILVVEEEDTAREAARTAILEVPGEGPVLAVHIYKNEQYAFRNKVGGATAGMYKATPTGWVEVDTSANPLLPGGDYNFTNYNFLASSTSNTMFWTDGVNKARMFDGTTVSVIDNVGMGANDKPVNLAAHNDRLFLAYVEGSLQSSLLGNPSDWVTDSEELGIGSNITDLIAGVGNTLVIFCDEAIKILKGTQDVNTWELETFSDVSGAYEHTAFRLFGTIFYMDDRGVTNLTAAQEFGDFASNSISQKVYKTIQENKSKITCATVSRDKNQYRLFFNTGVALYFSFLNKQLRGVTSVKFDIPVLSIVEGEDAEGNNVIYFTSEDGYVYQMDSGTSFDGSQIETKMQTAYYHYGSPRNWKKFLSITAEISSLSDLDIAVRTLFDYNSSYLPKAGPTLLDLEGIGDLYGEGVWGIARYSGSGKTNRLLYYVKGLGTNMSITFSTLSKYNQQHVVQNVITDYELSRRQL
jgi:hypothetical protein